MTSLIGLILYNTSTNRLKNISTSLLYMSLGQKKGELIALLPFYKLNLCYFSPALDLICGFTTAPHAIPFILNKAGLDLTPSNSIE